MAEKPVIRIGHLKITDHMILGITASKLEKTEETFQHASLEPVPMQGWNQVADALAEGAIDGAFLLAPTAMDLFKAGESIRLLLFTHRSGSILVKNRAAAIRSLGDFKGKIVLIPYQLSIHNMLFHRLLTEVGLNPGNTGNPDADVFLEVMAPSMMPDAIRYDEEGEIGGFIVAEPYGSQSITEGFGEEICLSKDLWPGHPCCVFVMREEVIGKYPDAVFEITDSLVKSGKFMDSNPAETALIGASFLNQEKAIIKNVLSEPPDRISADRLFPKIEELEAIQNYMYSEMKLFKDKIDLEKLIDTQFAASAGAK